MIFPLRRFFSSVLFSLLLSLAMYLKCSVKPLFCKASGYIGVKTFSFDDISDIRFFIDFDNCFNGFLYGWKVLVSILSCTSRKFTIRRLAWIVILRSQSLNTFTIAFLLRSVSGPERFRRRPSPSSLYDPTWVTWHELYHPITVQY